jgi:GrpB-like predicted nucleotidyltransferase (UPF0157 family)
MEKAAIVIVEYDPQWPIIYQKEKEAILEALGDLVLGIEHMGSTAVPGLPAKPLIDICLGLRQIDDAMKCVEPLSLLGYEYVPEYEKVLSERRYFRKGPPGRRTHHLHMWEMNTEGWKRHVLFRNLLRADPDMAQQYLTLKQELAQKYGNNRPAYSDAKSAFIEPVLAKARASGQS